MKIIIKKEGRGLEDLMNKIDELIDAVNDICEQLDVDLATDHYADLKIAEKLNGSVVQEN